MIFKDKSDKFVSTYRPNHGHAGHDAPAGYVFKDPCTGWNSFTASGTGSFAAISSEVGGSVCTQENLFGGPVKVNGMVYAARPDRPPIGQEMPVGGMLLPMLVMACAYVLVKVVKRKKSQAL